MSSIEYAQWVAKLQREIEALLKALQAGGMDIAPCKSCGQPVVCIPDGLALCRACAEKDGGE
jgi:hypothetical protein